MAAQHLTTADFDKVLTDAGDKPVLVDFFAEWCGPCKMIAPIIEEFVGEYDGKAVIAKVDVDRQHDLATRFGVMSIPTMIIFKKSEEVERNVGFSTKARIVEQLTKHL